MVDVSASGGERAAASRPTRGHPSRRHPLASLADGLARRIASLLLVFSDLLAYLLAYLALLPLLQSGAGRAAESELLGLAAAACVVLYASVALYPGYRLHDFEHLRRRVTATLKVAAFGAAAAALLLREWQPVALLVGFLLIGLVLQLVMRELAMRLCRQLGVWGERAVIIAAPEVVALLTRHFERHWRYGLLPEPLLRNVPETEHSRRRRIALLAGDTLPEPGQIDALGREFDEIVLLADTPSHRLGGMRPADIGGRIGLTVALGDRKSAAAPARRALDLAVAIPAALVAAPVVAIAAAAIYVIDPGAVFFRQTREGLGGKPVRVLKLRTMYQDAEARLEALFLEDPAMEAEWRERFKLKRDPRILPVVGHLLRSTSCDELPQLFNVLIGEMAVVGPRPFPDYHLKAMNAQFRQKRRTVMPGLTGLWQVSERSDADIERQRQLDEFYIDNRSLWFDLQILLRTIPAVLRRGGAY